MENQESKILDKEEMRERDAEFAHKVALQLNGLVDKKVLSRESLSSAPAEIMEEFINRFSNQIMYGRAFAEADEEKIKTMFGVREHPSAAEGADELVGENLKEKMKEFLRELRRQEDKNYPPIAGILLYGSRLHPYKTPNAGSDLDAIFYLKARSSECRNPKTIKSVEESVDRTKAGMAGLEKLPMDIFVESADSFLSQIKERGEGEELPNWFFAPNAAYFVGELPGCSEKEINELLQEYFSSAEVKEQRKLIIEAIKGGLL
jgi:predicted nucleotidyltransferase